MKAVILASMLALTALACTIPTRSADAGIVVCPGAPLWCYPSAFGGPLCQQLFCPDTPEYDPHRIYGSWVVRPEGQPFSNPTGTIWCDVWGDSIVVRTSMAFTATGNFNGQTGQYRWAYYNGTDGVTTFWMDQNFTLHLKAVSLTGSGPYYWMASRQ